MPLRNPFIKEDRYQKTVFLLLTATLVSLAFSVRIINSFSLMLLVAVTLLHPQRKIFSKRAFTNPYFICCLLLFAVRAAGIFYSNHSEETTKQLGGKLIWLAIPFFFCANDAIPLKSMQKLILYFSGSLLVVSIVCLVKALIIYINQHDLSVFFYHDLVKPFKHHAIFFSFYLFFCIVYWMEQGISLITSIRLKVLTIILISFFLGFIILLSSKLVIIVSIAYFFYFIIRSLLARKAKRTLLISMLLFTGVLFFVSITNNPIRHRFSDAISGNATLFRQEKFSPATYFNGVQLRLLIWRFTYEILQEKKAWWLGVSSGDAQHELDRKYEEANVYLGNGLTDTKGYKNFNCHNVFLQIALESGLIALFILLALISIFLWEAIKKRNRFALVFYLAILAFCFTESVLTSQYTILLFMFFPLLSLNIKKVA